MVRRLSETIGEGMSLRDQVNRSGLEKAIPALARMVNNGDLDRLSSLARVYASAEDALTDEMIGRVAETVAEGISLLSIGAASATAVSGWGRPMQDGA